jgi:mannose-6-phosphate isomerase-like protein (cupin superfamily)
MKSNIATNMIHLGLGATAVRQPPFTGMEWYEAYGVRVASDGAEGRLVAMHSFSENWSSWEVHPEGDEVVLCLSGEMTLHQQHQDGRKTSVTIGPGEYVINPPGCWHTADVEGEATALFITAGKGTLNRAR